MVPTGSIFQSGNFDEPGKAKELYPKYWKIYFYTRKLEKILKCQANLSGKTYGNTVQNLKKNTEK